MAMIKDIESYRKWINGFLDYLEEHENDFILFTGDMTKRTVTDKGDHLKLNSDIVYKNVFKMNGIAPVNNANSSSYGTIAVEKKYVKEDFLPENQEKEDD